MRYDPLVDHQKILGAHFVSRLNGRDHAILWWDARTPITRHTLAHVYSVSTAKGATLLRDKMAALKIKFVKDIIASWTREDVLECKGMGEAVAYTLFAIAKHHGAGTHKWYGESVTLATLKSRERAGEEHAPKRTDKEKRHEALQVAGTHILHTRKRKAHGRRHPVAA